MCSSRASLNFSPSNPDDECNSDGLSGGDSLEMSFHNKEVGLKDQSDADIEDHIKVQIQHEEEKRANGKFTEFEQISHQTEEDFNDEQEDVEIDLINEIEDYGYPKSFIINSIENNEINYATASYYLLKKRKVIEGSHLLTYARREISLDLMK